MVIVLDQICNDWNKEYKDQSHWLENDDQDGKLYSVCIESSKVEDISLVYDMITKSQGNQNFSKYPNGYGSSYQPCGGCY